MVNQGLYDSWNLPVPGSKPLLCEKSNISIKNILMIFIAHNYYYFIWFIECGFRLDLTDFQQRKFRQHWLLSAVNSRSHFSIRRQTTMIWSKSTVNADSHSQKWQISHQSRSSVKSVLHDVDNDRDLWWKPTCVSPVNIDRSWR